MKLKSLILTTVTLASINAFSSGHTHPPTQDPNASCEEGYVLTCQYGHVVTCSCKKEYVNPCTQANQEVRCHLEGKDYICGCTDVESAYSEE